MESGNGFDTENPYISLANSIKAQFKSLPPLPSEQDYLQRTDESLENYIKIVKESEPRLRSCYAETIGFKSDEFVKIILVDSAFIIQVLLRYSFPELQVERDPIFDRQWMLIDVWPELCLLENQLPFFILEKIYKHKKITVWPGLTLDLSIIELSHKFFAQPLGLGGTEEKLEEIKCNNCAHVVDFLRELYIPSNPRNRGESETINAPSMTELHRAGVKTPWHKWKANLKQNYFNTPWAIVSVIAAIFLIILAIIQTVCSILQVEK
ncbi:hypothetical protein FEM48_Zijuj06G0145200 [Ziziphus jujuba var. spinosa]|uniref:Uncharacterized protein n=1 Tax=Ziziphus jujuba var. spinosa TaxID=714518 RepID=A0A978V9U4_ZIZJJ|nr:hypothetical protein FEM48_Zijuj06G0145200 [Ziziphus jujuba var. spinosa]